MLSDEPHRVPVSEALPGVELYPLPPGEEVLAVHVLIKARGNDGDIRWWSRVGREHNSVEFLGALVAYTEHLRKEEAAGWSEDDSAPVQAGDDYI
jgi:hypothetical protein